MHPSATVADAVRQRWPATADAWLDAVSEELGSLCERYKAEPTQILDARYGFVVAVESPRGELVVRATHDPNGANQARILVSMHALEAAPVVHEDLTTWTVMDRVKPGYSLRERASNLSPDELAGILRPLIGQPAPAGLPYLGDWLHDRLVDENLFDIAPGCRIAPRPVREAALVVLADLAATGERGLCHGDASLGNFLSGPDGYVLIDPRGVSGEAAYDVAVLGLKSAGEVPAPRRIRELAKALGVDPERAERWAFVATAAGLA